MGAGAQGPPGPQGPQGDPSPTDVNSVANLLSTQNTFLNMLANQISSSTVGGSITDNISTKILKSPTAIIDGISSSPNFQSIIASSLANNPNLGGVVATGLISDSNNAEQLASSLVSQDNFLSNLSNTLTDPLKPYASKIRGPEGKGISNLQLTSGSLLLSNNSGIAGFRVAGNGGPWITGFSGGQLGTYNDNTNVSGTALKWDAQGNVTIGNSVFTTSGNLNVLGNTNLNNLYASGKIDAQNSITVNNPDDQSGLTMLKMHVGGLSDNGGSGTTVGSSFSIVKNGPAKTNIGGPNSLLLNNYGNPILIGDSSTEGNLFVLNNNSNFGTDTLGNMWMNTITGRNTAGNNSLIMNNTGTSGNMAGSLMLVGNSYGNTKGNRIVSVTDTLQIGDWQFFQDVNGNFQIINVNPKKQTKAKGQTPAVFYINDDGNIGTINGNIQGDNITALGDINAANNKFYVRGTDGYIATQQGIYVGVDGNASGFVNPKGYLATDGSIKAQNIVANYIKSNSDVEANFVKANNGMDTSFLNARGNIDASGYIHSQDNLWGKNSVETNGKMRIGGTWLQNGNYFDIYPQNGQTWHHGVFDNQNNDMSARDLYVNDS
ncbi:MAG: hypothetical protein EBX50_17280, partial [Chitinophagia bacterium]|nr:hypothetical protein [Chitinophagia bacterium]